jgi:hypothetical protein
MNESMRKTTAEIIGGTAVASAGFLCCLVIIGQVCVLCFVKKAAYAALIGMPMGSFAGIYLVDKLFYASKEFNIIGLLIGLALTMILLLIGIYLVAIAPMTFFAFPVLISLCCLLGHRAGLNIQQKRWAAAQRGSE